MDQEVRLLVRGWRGTNNRRDRDLTTYSTYITGKRVHVPEQGGYTGTTAGLNRDGFLLIDADDGTRRTVRSGGVRAL